MAASFASAIPASAQTSQAVVPNGATRWSLPPANLARRAASLGGPSMVARVLSAQGSPIRSTPAIEMASATSATFPAAAERRQDVATAGNGPDVFGSVALAVGSTPMDGQWRRAGADQSGQTAHRWAATFHSGNDSEALLGEVNRWVNARIRYTDDAAAGQADRWSGAAHALATGRGDCEDYALTKLQLLTAAGFDSRRLFLVVVRDLTRRADHAVLVARVGSRFLVLDNMTDAVIDSNEIDDYRPVMSFSAAGRWLHGYPVAPPRQAEPIRIASAAAPTAP